MKAPIKTKMQLYTLECICTLYDNICKLSESSGLNHESKEYLVAKNIIDLLILKLKKQILNKKDTKKPFKVSFQYFEAYYLVNFLSSNATCFKGEYERVLLLELTRKLHQDLSI